jgi:hypothetical protein
MRMSELACEITARHSLSVTLTRSGCERTWQLRREPCGWTYRVSWPGHVLAGGLADPHAASSKARQFLDEIRSARQDGWH